jgi:pyruvate dehydrogenase E1 component alpha subunit
MHIVDMSLGILGANGIVGGGLGIATGAALSSQRLNDGRISVAFFGDGALNEGLFYEVANMASLWKLPVVYVMENNQYGEYTSTQRSTAGTGPARAQALDIPTHSVDGNDVLAVYSAGLWAAERARGGEGPSFIECKTYRLRGHHMGDQGDTYGYRAQEEIELWKERCPIRRFGDFLTAGGWIDQAWLVETDHEVKAMIQDALKSAEAAPFPDSSEVYTDVYA